MKAAPKSYANVARSRYPTLCVIFGVDPRDDALLNGTLYPIDGVDIWDAITAAAGARAGAGASPAGARQPRGAVGSSGSGSGGTGAVLGREWLPITEQSLLWHSAVHNTTFKLITKAE